MPSEYEITYLSDPALTDEARDELNASVDAAISDEGGAIVESTPHTRARLKYLIKKQTVAGIRTLNIQLDPSKIEQLRAWLKKQAPILRTTILQTPPRPAVTPDMLFKAPVSDSAEPAKPPVKKSTKKVSMKEVEEGIEEALKEEVK